MKRVPYPDMGPQGRLPGGSEMFTFESFHDYSKCTVKSGLGGKGAEAGR